jgi:hypothetical protein
LVDRLQPPLPQKSYNNSHGYAVQGDDLEDLFLSITKMGYLPVIEPKEVI